MKRVGHSRELRGEKAVTENTKIRRIHALTVENVLAVRSAKIEMNESGLTVISGSNGSGGNGPVAALTEENTS